MVISHAAREDIYDAVALVIEAWRWAYKGILAPEHLDSLSVEERYEKWLADFDEGQNSLLLLREEGELLGICKYGPVRIEGYPGAGEIYAIYLREAAAGKGYGHALFTRVEEDLLSQGCTGVVLDVLSANDRAIRFYRAHGYEKTGEGVTMQGGVGYAYDVMYKGFMNV